MHLLILIVIITNIAIFIIIAIGTTIIELHLELLGFLVVLWFLLIIGIGNLYLLATLFICLSVYHTHIFKFNYEDKYT